MLNRYIIRLDGMRYAVVGLTILLVLAAAPLAAAMGSVEEDAVTSFSGAFVSSGGWSGDDAYDPAAGGTPELSVSAAVARSNFGSSALSAVGSYSGDDAYDPAAGGTPELSVSAVLARSNFGASELSAVGSLSGDDAYDPAAGGTPEQSLFALVACGPSAEEIARRSALAIAGGFSGDDAYDPAAGGMPELSLFAFAGDLGLMAACEPAASSN